MSLRRVGFTLAEVLIVLVIIGVVASITIPSLVQSFQKQAYVAALQKEYSVLSQAFNLLQNEYGGNITSVITGETSPDAANLLNEMAKYLKVQKNCGNSKGCWYDLPLYELDGTIVHSNLDSSWNGSFGKAILTDGTMVAVDIFSPSCSDTSGTSSLKICGDIEIDINGAKGPNTWGRDFFWFWITSTGIYPFGSDNDGYICSSHSAGCAGKVLQEGKMDY